MVWPSAWQSQSSQTLSTPFHQTGSHFTSSPLLLRRFLSRRSWLAIMIQQSDARPLTLQRSLLHPGYSRAYFADWRFGGYIFAASDTVDIHTCGADRWRLEEKKTRGCEGQFNFLQQEDELQPMGGRHLGFTSDLGFSTSYLLMYRAGLKQRKAPSSDIYICISLTHIHTSAFFCFLSFTHWWTHQEQLRLLDWTDRRIQESNHQPPRS